MNTHFEPLGESFGLFVCKEHSFGTDAFLLSDFSCVKKTDTACDLGTGCGIIPLLWYRDFCVNPKSVLAVDIQQKAIFCLEKTLEKYDLKNITPLLCDLKALPKEYNDSFTLVTCNPPYKKEGAGILSETAAEKIARHETACDIFDITKTAARLLKFGGRLCLCQRPERLADVIQAMRKAGIEPKRLTMVQKNENSKPWLFLIEGKKGAKPFLEITKPLLIYENGEYSKKMRKMYFGEEE